MSQAHQENEDQVGELLDILIQKTNRDFENFCDALDAVGRGGVVRNLLITPGNTKILQLISYFITICVTCLIVCTLLYMAGDLDSAVESLRTFLKTHFTDINLYTSSKEARPVSLHKLFVNMEWEIKDEPESESDEDSDSDSNLEASTSEQLALITKTKEQETSTSTPTKDGAPVLQAFLKKVRIK